MEGMSSVECRVSSVEWPRGRSARLRPTAQTFKSAGERIWKSATQQTWKSAVGKLPKPPGSSERSLDTRRPTLDTPSMRVPIIAGVIRRRILVNFRVDPEVMARQLPAPMRPKLHGGAAIAGICLIRLEAIRPKRFPAWCGIASENAAHRVAVEWDEDGVLREGVYIPRRDTGSWLNHLAGGRLFPGEHHLADFRVETVAENIDLEVSSRDGAVAIRLRGETAKSLPADSGFATLGEASAFFCAGSLGFSVTSDPGRLDGMELKVCDWKVEPLAVTEVFSSYFSDVTRFPPGSVEFDCALRMRDLVHEWHSAGEMAVTEPARSRETKFALSE